MKTNINALDPVLCTVRELFLDDAVYSVPIYQRNYSWEAEQIEQLISDVDDARRNDDESYFLGNLIVTTSASEEPGFVVIDGQQRLTTLYLLLSFLGRSEEAFAEVERPRHSGRLRYESRPRSSETLRRIDGGYPELATVAAPESRLDAGIHQGFNVIEQYMDQNLAADRAQFTNYLVDHVKVVRASLPRSTDVNRYFEVMNTRGQQLQQVDIVKARLMSFLQDETERACFAWIWDACADMHTYVQRPLTAGEPELRRRLFGEDWSWLRATSFNQLLVAYEEKQAKVGSLAGRARGGASMSIDEALGHYGGSVHEAGADELESDRFRSTIEFPVFLLHVLKVSAVDEGEEELEKQLDDKRLIQRFDRAFRKGNPGAVRRFAFELLRCRNLLDGFILKREFLARYDEDGAWAIQRAIKRTKTSETRSHTMGYVGTFSSDPEQTEEDDLGGDATNCELLLLQSMLRVTYTSPRTMHWITMLLKYLTGRPDVEHVTEQELALVLRDYARARVREAYFDSEQPTGFAISRVVFTYLDFLLITQKTESDFAPGFVFTFRTSIEHFYPQHPDEQQSGVSVLAQHLDQLGNLALVSVGANSKFSNSLPKAKAENFQTTIEAQSPKLKLMADITRREDGWGDQQVQSHQDHMVSLLRQDLEGAWLSPD